MLDLHNNIVVQILTILCDDNSKPIERWGRKAMGLRGAPMIARLPKRVVFFYYIMAPMTLS